MARPIELSKPLLGGLLFVVIGAFAMIHSYDYDIGTPLRMGPGFLPMCLSALLLVLGLSAVLRSLALRSGVPVRRPILLPAMMLTLGTIWFALTVERLGLAVAIGGLVAIVSYPQWRRRPLEIVAMALLLTGFAAALFVYALNLPLRLI
jgi:hypothetical protein